METCEGDNTCPLKSEAEAVGMPSSVAIAHFQHSSLVTDEFSEAGLSQKFDNLGIGSDNGDAGKIYPLRPHAEDCPYYLRTGTCKFGLNCRYNHPVGRTNQNIGKGMEKEKDEKKDKSTVYDGLSGNSHQIECKYYLTIEGCKYGTSCRYKHSKDEHEIAPSELNFLGLPIRPGEKECLFYMRNGSCGYGDRCKFHHPDPISVGVHACHKSTTNNDSVGQFGIPLGNYIGESLYISGASQPVEASWPVQMLSDQSSAYQDNCTSYMPTVQFPPRGTLQNHEWNGHQAPYFAEERTRHPHAVPAARSLTEKVDISNQFEEFPDRPGQPNCEYFMKTGDCKFKLACRYHHPKTQAPKLDCSLSDKGLPLRPGRRICRHYEQSGICKYGRACLFDHPANQSSSFSLGSVSEF